MVEEPRTWTETFKVEGGQLLEKVRELVHEGNVRHITIRQDGRTVIELPITVGLVGVALAPMLVAVGAVAALVTNCTIEVQRETSKPTDDSAGGPQI